MANLQYTIDSQPAITAIDNFNKAIGTSAGVIADFNKVAVTLDKDGKSLRGTLEQLTESGQKVTQVFKRTEEGMKLSTTTIKSAKQTFDDLDATLKSLGTTDAKRLFPVPDNASVNTLLKYNSAIIGLQKSLVTAVSGGASTLQIENLFKQFSAQGPQQFAASISTLSPQLQSIAQQLLAVGVAAQQAGSQGTASFTAFGLSLNGLARIAIVQGFRRTITALINEVRDGITAAIDYQIRLQQVANVTNQSGTGFDAFRARVRALSNEFATPISDVLSASSVALTSQLGNATAGFQVFTNALRLAEATGTPVAATTDILTTSLQAFRITADQSGRAANVLFNVATQSRSPLEEVRTAVGRVAQTAEGLGLSFEQVSALFLTISQRGGRPVEAFAALNQVMGRLLSPSKDLQVFLDRLGTPTAALAVQTFGLTGFLQRLNDAARESPHQLGDLAGSIITLRNLMGIAGDQTQLFERNLRSLTSTQAPNFLDAAFRVQQTPAQQLRQTFNEIKNVFIEDIGGGFITGLGQIINSVGGAKAAFNDFKNIIITASVATGAYLAVARGVPLALGLITTSAATSASAMSALTGVTAASTVGWTTWLGVVLAAVAAGKLLADAQEEAAQAESRRVREQQARLNQEARERLNQTNARQLQENARVVTEANRVRLQQAAESIRRSELVRDIEISNQRRVTEELRVNGQTFLDDLRRQSSEATQIANQAKQDVISSQRAIETFQQNTQQRTFQRRLSIEQDPLGAINIINQRIRTLRQQATATFENPFASREEIETARAQFTEIERLLEERFQRETAINQARAIQNGQYREVTLATGQVVRQVFVDTSVAERRANELVQERIRLERQYQQILQARQAAQEANANTIRSAELNLQSFIRQQASIRPFNDAGQLTPTFALAESRGRGGALAEFNRQTAANIADIRKQAQLAGIDVSALVASMEREAEAIRRVFGATTNLTGAQNSQRGVVQGITQDTERLNRVSEQLRQQQQSALGFANRIGGAARLSTVTALTDSREFTGPLANFNTSARAINQYREAILAVTAAEAAFRAEGGQTQQNLDRLNNAITQAGEAATLTRTELSALDPISRQSVLFARGLGANFLDETNRFIDTQLPRMREEFENLRRIVVQPNTGIAALEQQRQDILTPLQLQAQQFGNIGVAAQNAQNLVGQALQNINNQAQGVNQQLQIMQQLFNGLGGFGGVGFNPVGGGEAGFAATGGIAGMSFPGTPKGTDRYPYWLTKGEFIMPADKTSKFFTQLVAMKSGIEPRYAATGGVVSVGDINVSVQGGSTSEQTIRAIGRGLRREIKRGTIKLN